ncbi:MAG TPA: FtsH protease activity modulator HflK [Steroidobacteraceae bacterium]|jgi:membrane protease subunit HflK|nr:FtsH protease activity modulator HflK [Steroidobacteraceae bacterium]
MAWNEPGGEKRNPWNRPPHSQNDLDDVLRNLQRRLAALFGRSGGGGGPSASSPSFARGFGTVAVLIGAVWVASGAYRVDAQERAVVLRFGAYVRTVGPGYNWHLPWPIERKVIVNVSQPYSVQDDAQMLTADTNLVEVRSAVQYTQPDPSKYLFRVRGVEDTLRQVSESALREAVGQSSLDKALAFDSSITDHAMATLQRTIDSYDIGVHIIGVRLEEVVVPEAVQEAQRDAIKADKDRQRYQQDAETYRNDVVPRARGEAAKVLLEADAYRQQVVAVAQGETARFDQVLAQYERAPAVTRERIYLDTMSLVYKNARKVIVDTKSAGNVLYLPLDKLMSPGAPPSSGSGDSAGGSGSHSSEVQVSPPEDPARARGVR